MNNLFRHTLRSRRGSSSVFLCVIMSALVSICFAMIYSTIEYATVSRADAVLLLAGDSILSEYDEDIQNNYGVFLLRSRDRELSARMKHYVTYTFSGEPAVTVTDLKASGARFCACDPSLIRSQILAYMKDGGGLLLKSKKAEKPDTDTSEERSLCHGPTIASLPSRQLPQADNIAKAEAAKDLITDPASVFTDGTERYLLSSYVLGMFNTRLSAPAEDHFFRYEAEYILNGRLTDADNMRKTSAALRALRIAPNLIHIYTDQEKHTALSAAAEALTPGPAAALTEAALAAAWAYAESANDAALLAHGFSVPLAKDPDSWAISLRNVIDYTLEESPGEPIRPRENKGLDYTQYLRMLLFLEDSDMITARVLDLIQINMRKDVDGGFLIAECCCGISMEATVNGRTRRYEKLFERQLYD